MQGLWVKILVFSIILGLIFSGALVLQAQSKASPSNKKVNINTASVDELQRLPRIGPNVAQRIVDFRKEHGRFKRIEEIMKVRGIGEKTFQRIKSLITVGKKTKKK